MEMRQDYIEFIDLLGFPEEDKKILTNSFDTVMTSPAAVQKVHPFIENYKNGAWLDYFTYMGEYEKVLEEVCTNKLTDSLMFHLAMAAYSYPFFEKNGFSREVWVRSMKDFTFKNEECKVRYGVVGTFVNWFARWYFGNRAAFGRLQYESYTCYFDIEDEELSIKQGDDIVNIHIPSDKSAPLSDEEVDASLRQAAEYYGKLYGKNKIVFHCDSWMLHPCHMDKLPENSKIVKFAKRFKIFRVGEYSEEDIWRIFPIKEYDGVPENLPENTTLQRVYKQLLINKEPIGEAAGYFVYTL